MSAKLKTERGGFISIESLVGKKVVGADLLYTKNGQLHIGLRFDDSSTLIVVSDDVQQCEIHKLDDVNRRSDVFDFLKSQN